MRHDLDYSRVDDARAVVANGDEEIEVNCSACQGMCLPGRKPGQPGYCGRCGGICYVRVKAWTRYGHHQAVDYWQSRALVAESALIQKGQG